MQRPARRGVCRPRCVIHPQTFPERVPGYDIGRCPRGQRLLPIRALPGMSGGARKQQSEDLIVEAGHQSANKDRLVRVARNAPNVGLADVATSANPITGAAGLEKANLLGGDDTG